MKILNSVRSTRFRWTYIFVPAIVIIAAFLLPPIIRSLRNVVNGVGSVTAVVSGLLEGSSNLVSGFLEILGLAPETTARALAKNPPRASFWNVDFWSDQGNNYPPTTGGDYGVPGLEDDVYAITGLIHGAPSWWSGWTGEQVIQQLKNYQIESQQAFSYFNFQFLKRYGRTFQDFLGWWSFFGKLSNADFQKVNDYLASLPKVF